MWAVWLAASAWAEPIELTWQGRVLDGAGMPVTGTASVEVVLFGSEAGTDMRWSDAFTAPAQDGYVSLVLGSGVELDHDLFATGALWVEVRNGVTHTPYGPRQRMSRAPSAVVSDAIRVEGAPSASACGGQLGALVYDTSVSRIRLCDGTNWVYVTTPPVVELEQSSGAWRWANGAMASSCKGYRNPGSGFLAATANGRYHIDPPGSLAPTVVECEMSLDGGGWTLVSNRREHPDNRDSCESNLAGFFTNGCGAVTAIGESDSYAMTATYRTSLIATEMLVTQYLNGAFDADDAYILAFGGATDLLPNNTGLVHTALAGVCNLTRTSCDTSGVVWKYVGSGWFGSTWCNSAQSTGSYGGNYGYCHDGTGSQYNSNSFVGDRSGYDETKLWDNQNGASAYQERIWVR